MRGGHGEGSSTKTRRNVCVVGGGAVAAAADSRKGSEQFPGRQ
jgi:dTDP-4-dehydrorhamnose 3,5-epimerase-like enzyme